MNTNFSYKNIVKEFNLIFKDLNNIIKKDVELKNNIKTREREITFIDALLYKFSYSMPETTKQQIVSSFNFDNDKLLTVSGFEYREKTIPISSYTVMYNKVYNLYKKLMKIDNNEPIIIAVDGTFNNINSQNKKDNLETCLNMGYYDVTNDLPLEINIQGYKKKNNELSILKSYLKNNKFPKNSILVLDRAYCSYEFINYLVKTNLKFVIRFRNNCKNFDNVKQRKDLRILKYFDEFNNILPYDKYKKYIEKTNNKDKYKITTLKNTKTENKTEPKNKTENIFKNAEIKIKYEYTLLTNLNIENYNDEKIKEIYKKRWNIEIFFKLLKYNFKFEHLVEHNKEKNYDEYKKMYLVNLIIIYLSKIIEKTHLNNNNIKKDFTEHKKGKKVKYVYRPNKSNIIKGVYKILKKTLNGNLDEKTLEKTCDAYVFYNKIELGLHKERKSKTPFLKWYVKGHSNRSLLCKFIEAFLKKDTEKLNKNNRVLYKNCIIKLS